MRDRRRSFRATQRRARGLQHASDDPLLHATRSRMARLDSDRQCRQRERADRLHCPRRDRANDLVGGEHHRAVSGVDACCRHAEGEHVVPSEQRPAHRRRTALSFGNASARFLRGVVLQPHGREASLLPGARFGCVRLVPFSERRERRRPYRIHRAEHHGRARHRSAEQGRSAEPVVATRRRGDRRDGVRIRRGGQHTADRR